MELMANLFSLFALFCYEMEYTSFLATVAVSVGLKYLR